MRKTSGRSVRYTRRSFFVDSKAIDQARKALGAGTNAEAVRLAVDRVVEMEKVWALRRQARRGQKGFRRSPLDRAPERVATTV
jgi:hypothetical protein